MNEALREQVLSKPFTDTAKLASGVSDTPARDGDFSATAGVSSLQVFDGEDLMEGDRRLMQAAQVGVLRRGLGCGAGVRGCGVHGLACLVWNVHGRT